MRMSARANPAAADLLRHAFADVPGNSNLARSWAALRALAGRAARRRTCSTCTRAWTCPCCCCGPTATRMYPLAIAEEALALLPNGQLRVLESAGFLLAYDDPVGLARELSAFCG